MIDINDVVQLLSDLVRINSINPWLVEGGPGEIEIGQYIVEWLQPFGVEVALEEVEDGRKNVVVRWPGTGEGKSLCLYAHTDTVGDAAWQDRALSPRVEGDRLYGLGAADDKGHAAIAMLVLKTLVETQQRLKGDVWLSLVIDEEGTSSGAVHFVKHHKPDAAIVLEAFGYERIAITHQGFGWLDIIVHGKAAHGSAPDEGVDAIVHMAEVVTRLTRLYREKFVPSAHPLNGITVFHTGMISGGTDYATYPDRCVLGIEIGTQPGETIEDRVADIDAIFSEVKTQFPTFRGEVNVQLARDPFEASGHEDLWKSVSRAVVNLIGKPVEVAGANAWGDAALYQAAGIPTVMLGAQGDQLHAADEWVSLSDLVKLGEILTATIQDFCA